jgi:hypothetical protein
VATSTETASSEPPVHVYLDPRLFKHASVVPGRKASFEIATQKQNLNFRCEGEEEAHEWVKVITGAVDEATARCSRSEWSFVYVNVYDMGKDWRLRMFNVLLQDLLHLGGLFHAGVEVYGQEYMFGSNGEDFPVYKKSGVTVCGPRACQNHAFRCSQCVGLTGLSKSNVEAMVAVLAWQWPLQVYRIFGPNCITFCREFCQLLGTARLPGWVDSLARRAGKRNVMKLRNTCAIRCAQGHDCKFQSQGLLARLVESIRCDGCWLEIPPGQGHWHCGACDFTLCKGCSAELVVKSCSYPSSRH